MNYMNDVQCNLTLVLFEKKQVRKETLYHVYEMLFGNKHVWPVRAQ